MDIFGTVYNILNPAQIGIQAGASTAKEIVPAPEWILTPYAEEQLSVADPAAYKKLVSDFVDLQKSTTSAYQQVLNPLPSLANMGKYVIMGVIVIGIIIIFSKKGR